MTLFDTHVHFTVPELWKDLEGVFARAKDAGVAGFLSVSTDLDTSRRSLELVRARSGVFAAVGIHPGSAGHVARGWEEKLERLIEDGGPAAIGECGLDGYHLDPPLDVQEPVFRVQVRLARKHQRPLIMHTRKATWQALRILEEENALDVGGIFHCIEGDEIFARAAVNAGFHLGVGGTSTYPRNDVLRAMLARMPKDRIVLETDAPWLPPQPVRGKRNEPAYLAHTAAVVAEALGLGAEAMGELTTENALKLLRK